MSLQRLRAAATGRLAYTRSMAVGFLLWLILAIISLPLAIIALFVYPILWLLLLPFRIVGIAVEGVLETLRAIVLLPSRVIGGRR